MRDHPSVVILGYSDAAMFLRQDEAAQVRAIIAIHGQREYPVDTHQTSHALVLQFDDTEAPCEDDPLHAARLGIRRREAAAIGLSLTPPTEGHARAIIDFARQIRTLEGTLLCHCLGGISRSPAAALLCLAEWMGPGHEHDCVEHVFAIRPAAMPHRDLVRFGDKILGRNGCLLTALDNCRP